MFRFRRLKRNDKALSLAESAAAAGFVHKTPQDSLFNKNYLDHTSWKRQADTRSQDKFRKDFINFMEDFEDIKIIPDWEPAPLGGMCIGYIKYFDVRLEVFHLIKNPV